MLPTLFGPLGGGQAGLLPDVPLHEVEHMGHLALRQSLFLGGGTPHRGARRGGGVGNVVNEYASAGRVPWDF